MKRVARRSSFFESLAFAAEKRRRYKADYSPGSGVDYVGIVKKNSRRDSKVIAPYSKTELNHGYKRASRWR